MNDDYLNYGNPVDDEDKVYECTECGKPIEQEGVCSNLCFQASMR